MSKHKVKTEYGTNEAQDCGGTPRPSPGRMSQGGNASHVLKLRRLFKFFLCHDHRPWFTLNMTACALSTAHFQISRSPPGSDINHTNSPLQYSITGTSYYSQHLRFTLLQFTLIHLIHPYIISKIDVVADCPSSVTVSYKFRSTILLRVSLAFVCRSVLPQWALLHSVLLCCLIAC